MPWNRGTQRTLQDKRNISSSLIRHYSRHTPYIRTRNLNRYPEPYNYERKINCLSERIKESSMSIKNRSKLLEYRDFLSITTKPGYVYNTIRTIYTETEPEGPPFCSMREKEWMNVYRKVMLKRNSERTKHDKMHRIRLFITWLNKGNRPKFLDKMKVRVKNKAEKYVSLEDVKRFLEACESDEEKTFFATLWEGGFAVCELLKARRKDITIRKDVIEIYVESKNRDRTTPILRQRGRMFPLGAYRLLAKHLRRQRLKPDDRIWSMVAYNQAQYRCNKIKKKIGLYQMHTHSFRKARATYNDEAGMSYAQNCVFGGWEIGSRTLQHYILTSGRTLIPSLKKLNENA
jgi:integrase